MSEKDQPFTDTEVLEMILRSFKESDISWIKGMILEQLEADPRALNVARTMSASCISAMQTEYARLKMSPATMLAAILLMYGGVVHSAVETLQELQPNKTEPPQ